MDKKLLSQKAILALPPYNKNAKCRKCGQHNAKVKWVSQADVSVDYLERTCKDCGFSWNERCNDAGKQ